MADVSFVTPWLAVGGAIATEEDVLEILQQGITHSSTVAWESTTTSFCEGGLVTSGILLRTIATRSHHGGSWTRSRSRKLRFKDPGAKVLVHCTGGIDRSPSIAYAILRSMGHTEAEAEHAVLSGRPEARFPYKRDADVALRALGSLDSVKNGNAD